MAGLAAGIWVVLILILTLRPDPLSAGAGGLIASTCIVCGPRGGSDAILNLLLFAPLGFTAVLAGMRPRRAAAAAIVFSAVIEIAQLGLAGRYTVLGDIVWNGLGGAAGAAAARWLRALRRRELRHGGRAGAIIASGAGLIWGGAVCLLVPAPQGGVYYGQWTPDLGNLGVYRGVVLDARIGDQPAPSWRIADSDAARRAITDGRPVVVRVVAGPRPAELAPIFSVYDSRQRESLLIGADGADLVLRVRRLGAALRLDAPDMRWRNAFGGAGAGDTLTIVVRRSGRYAFTASLGDRVQRLATPPARGWALLFHARGASRNRLLLLDAVWIMTGLTVAGLGVAVARARACRSALQS